jgi:hypothetical protein
MEISFTSLAIVAAVGFAAPLLLGRRQLDAHGLQLTQ